ncbi:MAG: PKD domain-containing protein [Bacteroidetes bacterium]|nr:PKD domain-containing protein [Bacteroidota bacterium]
MKKTIFLLLLVFIVLESFSQIPTNGLMAWYKFNGNAGDSSGFGNNASPNTNQWQPILSKHISSSYPYDSYLLGTGTPSPVNNRWYGVISNTNNFSQNAITKSTAYNTWTLLTFTYDGSSIKSYINGILDTTNSFSGNIVYNSAGLYIGQNGIGGQYFKGTIDDITIHNRALNDYEIAYMYSPIKNNTISGSQLLCAGALTSILSGNTPTGGTDTINYSYTWISSNLSATDGFNLASGVNDQKDYSPSYIYSTTWFRRIVQSGNSYDTSAAIVITIKPKPSIYIGVNNSSQCITSNSFSFTDNTSYNGSFTRLWNLGNGTIDTTRVANPTKSYGSAGTYYVSYLAIADNGCRDSSILTVSVGTMPSVGFNVNNYVQCAGNAFNFSDTSKASSGSLTRVWNFGGGPNDISTQIYPTKNYVNGGTYNVKLVVNNYGCIDSASKTITVLAKPNAGFTMSNAIQCVTNNSFSFADTTTLVNVSRKWFFGNGDTSNIANPNIIYSQPNNYIVKLVLSNINGCKDSASKNITVSAKPNPGFVISNPSQCINGNSFVLYDTSKVALGLLNRVWYLGDGGTSSVSPVTKSYYNAGTYTIKLLVSNAGCKDSINQTVYVNPKPSAGFILNNATQCYKDHLFIISDTSIISTGTYNRTWYMGDATFTSSNPVYKTYNNIGNYSIKLVLNSDKGCRDSVTKNVIVNASPIAGFTINNTSQCLNNNSFSFLDTSNISTGTISRVWYYDNTLNIATTNPLIRNYTSSNSYTIKLIISSNKGCKDSVLKSINVNPLPNVSIVSSNQKDAVCDGNSISLSGKGAFSYSWDNGITNSVPFVPTATKTYSVNGTDQNGCVGIASKTIKLFQLPVVTINSTASAVCSGYPVTLSGEGAINYSWNGGVINGMAFTPSATNSYTVTGTDSNSCSNTASKTITVHPLPKVVANTLADPICIGSSSILYGSGATTYTWTGGVINNVPFAPSSTASYTVTGIDSNNCSNTASKTITVNQMPNRNVSINGWSISSFETGATYQWINCNNNQIITGANNKTYSVTANGSYAVIVTKNNCLDTSACTTFSNVGIDEYLSKKASLSVFPNPNSGSFTISSDVDGDFIITNELGQNVMNISLNKNNKFTQTITTIDNGIYFIIGINSYKKIVVNK